MRKHTPETPRRHPGGTQEAHPGRTRGLFDIACCKTIAFYSKRLRHRASRIDGSDRTLAKSPACAQKLNRGDRRGSGLGNPGPLPRPPEPLQPRDVWETMTNCDRAVEWILRMTNERALYAIFLGYGRVLGMKGEYWVPCPFS